jgi:hypothetical protein
MTFDPAKHISADSPVTRGPIVIDDHGRILSGHDRHDELLDRSPEEEARYKLILINHSPQFGVDPMAIMRMKTPVLVRKISPKDMPHQ